MFYKRFFHTLNTVPPYNYNISKSCASINRPIMRLPLLKPYNPNLIKINTVDDILKHNGDVVQGEMVLSQLIPYEFKGEYIYLPILIFLSFMSGFHFRGFYK